MPSPWDSKVFKGLTSRMIRTFTADDLRRECAAQSLITQSQKTKFAVLVGPAMQNEALLDAVGCGDDRSFHLFLECIREVEPEANVSAILEKLDQIDKYRTAAGEVTWLCNELHMYNVLLCEHSLVSALRIILPFTT